MAQRLYPLQALLSVRHYREDAARNALRLEERRLVQAREEVGRPVSYTHLTLPTN